MNVLNSCSSFSSTKTTHPIMTKSAPTRLNKAHFQKYFCSKCNMQYKYFGKYNGLGKIPLILHCNHTLCEECIQSSFGDGGVTCIECGEFSQINPSNKRVQDIFPPNFYLMGVMSLQPNVKDCDSKLKPTGLTYTSLSNTHFGSLSALGDQPDTLESILQDKCCKDLCKNSASLRCLDCNEVFCEHCCEPFHNSTRGFRKHRIVPSSSDIVQEVLAKCETHTNQPLEVFCKSCEKYCCIYCFIGKDNGHNGHDYFQISNADVVGVDEFQTALENAGDKLKRFILAHKQVTYHLQTASEVTKNPLDAAISTYFLRLHAQLQCLEKKIRKDAETVKTKNIAVLNEIDQDLRSSIRTLNGLIETASNVSNANNNVKVNVTHLIDKMKRYNEAPCYLVVDNMDSTQFICPDPFENLEKTISLQFNVNENNYKLLSEDELPENYDMQLPNDLASLDTLRLNKRLSKSPESVSSHSSVACSQISTVSSTGNRASNLLTRPIAVEGWIKGVHESRFKKTPSLQPNHRHSVCVSYIDTPENFYVQLVSQHKDLQRLNRDITYYVKRNSSYTKQRLEKGALYIVNYNGPDWYRGRVVGIETKDTHNIYTVEFIDYGNTKKTTELKDFIAITEAFALQPPFARLCKLFDIHPAAVSWSEREALYMAEIIADTEVIMVIMECGANILEVDLLSCSGVETTSIRNSLIFAGYGTSDDNTTELICSSTMQSIRSNVKLHSSGQNLKNGDELTVQISNVKDLQNIYVQMVDHLHHVEHLQTAMRTYYIKKAAGSMARGENIYNPKKDMIVAVNLNDTYVRGVVTEILRGKGCVVVLLVDFGQTHIVHYSLLRKLPDKFRTLQCQAILVKLSNLKRIEDEEADKKIINYFEHYIAQKPRLRLVIVDKEEIPSVVLFELLGSMENCINKTLAEEGLAIPSGNISELLSYTKSSKNALDSNDSYVVDLMNTIQSSRETGLQEDSDSDNDKDVIKKRVHVITCKSPDEIFVELNDSSASKLHGELHSSLQVYYSAKHKKQKRNWKINDSCVAYNSKCDQFYRGIIVDKDDGKFKVMLRDIVQEILVPSEELFVLEDQFKQCRDRSIRCHLASVSPAGDKNKWSGLAIDFLRNIFEQHHDISMTKNGAVDRTRKSVPVTMWYTEIKLGGALERSKEILHNINKLLVKNGLALKIPTHLNNSKESSSESVDTIVNESENIEVDTSVSSVRTTNSPANNMGNGLNKSCTQNSAEYHALFFAPAKALKNVSPIMKTIDWNEIIDDELLNKNKLLNDRDDLQQSENLQVNQPMPLNNDSRWLPPTPFTDKNFRAIVTNVGNNGCIYAHLSSYKDVLRNMEEKINAYFKQTQPEPLGTVWMCGQLCTVKYHLNEEWYRGQIISVNDDVIKVFLIDYGNEEDVHHEDLRFAVMYLNIPSFANKIQLHQVHPVAGSKWLTSDLDELHKILVDNEVEVSVVKKNSTPDVPISALVKLHNVNINEYMRTYSANLVNSTSIDSSAKVDNDSDVIIEDENFDIIPSRRFEHAPLPQSMLGQKIEVTVTTIMGYNEVLLEILCDKVGTIRKLFESISEDIQHKADQQDLLNTLEVGSACIAKFSEDGQWYRGEIIHLDHIDLNEIYVWFVDFGNYESVHTSCIKTVHPNWFQLPVVQYKAIIDGIRLNDPSSLSIVMECMLDYCNTTKTAEFVSVNPLRVKLYHGDELAYKDLIDQGLLIKTD